MRIDAHAHLYPDRFLDLIERQGDKHPVEVRREGAGGERKLIVAGREFFTFLPDFFDLDVRLEQMAAAAVDMQVLSLGPPMVYWAEPELGAELCQAFNDEIASIVRRHPDKFVALAAVPLQDVEAAIAEMERAARELDMRGVMIPTVVGMKEVDSPEFIPFYEAAAEMGLPVFMHPMPRPGPEGLRLRDYRLDVTVGFVMDTTLAAARSSKHCKRASPGSGRTRRAKPRRCSTTRGSASRKTTWLPSSWKRRSRSWGNKGIPWVRKSSFGTFRRRS